MALRFVSGGEDGKVSTFNGDVYAADVNIHGNGTIAMGDGADINGAVTTTWGDQGTLTLQGTSTVTGQWVRERSVGRMSRL